MIIRKKEISIEYFLRYQNKESIREEIKKYNPNHLIDKLREYLDYFKNGVIKLHEHSPEHFDNLGENTGKFIKVLLEEHQENNEVKFKVLRLLCEYSTIFVLGVAKRFALHKILCDNADDMYEIYRTEPSLREKIKALFNMGHYLEFKESFPSMVFSHGGEGVVMSLTSWNIFETEMKVNNENKKFVIEIDYNVTLSKYSEQLLYKHFQIENNDFNQIRDSLINDFQERNMNFEVIEKLQEENRHGYWHLIRKIHINNYKQVSNDLMSWYKDMKCLEKNYFEQHYKDM